MNPSVCFIASEVAPLAKAGGLADVAAALCKYLHSSGTDVRLFMPFYSSIDRSGLEHHPVDYLQDLPLGVGPHSYRYSVYSARLPGSSLFLYLIDIPVLYSRSTLYTNDPDEHLRFLALTRAAIECCQRMGWSPDILHCNDWHTAFAPLLLRYLYGWDRRFARTRTVLTIHNIGYQGVFSAGQAADVGLGAHSTLLHQDDLRAGRVNPLKHGILYADAITTVSPTYAREICGSEYGMGLEGTLRARGGALTGILNGVDYDVWDPRTDAYLPTQYGPDELEVKAALKQEFLARMGLEAGPGTALLGLIARLTPQKGIDLLFGSLPELLATRDVCFVALGNGEARYEEFFTGLQRRYPKQVVFHRGYSEELSHWIEAASDLFLMPSRYEPCGLNQLYSLRYGTIPIVRRTGGLADSVIPYDPVTGNGTGFVFNDFDTPALAWAMRLALDLYPHRAAWTRLMRNAMAADFSWERQGALYVELYARLLGVSVRNL
jgi:starch synthase